ncbi:MAG: hypothetical protein JSR46_00460 [Verrucomicrobia bacterium]|nr:hypothetical protein [Verrucomicrobiota bacterium]
MNQYAILLGYFDKQMKIIEKLFKQVVEIDVTVFELTYMFSMLLQQLYTALEDLFKQIAKAFENHIEQLESFHKELLVRMNTEIPKIRPMVISRKSLLLLDKIRAFRHFIRHAYDCELDSGELEHIKARLKEEFQEVLQNLQTFRGWVVDLAG